MGFAPAPLPPCRSPGPARAKVAVRADRGTPASLSPAAPPTCPRSTPDYATPVDQQFQVEYDPGQVRGNEESESRSPAQSPVRFSKRPRHITGGATAMPEGPARPAQSRDP